MPPTIFAIVGPSGSGKTVMSEVMSENGIPAIISYTTRPMRTGEVNGKEHWFVTADDIPDKSEMIAYTKFGGYEYWACKSQVISPCNYVIDEDGLRTLKEKYGRKYNIFSFYVKRPDKDIALSGVDKERRERDKQRNLIDENKYDYVLDNIYPLDEFERIVVKITELIKKDIENVDA